MATNKPSAVFNPQEEIAMQSTIHSNLKQEIIVTTKDKVRLMLKNFREAVECKQQAATYGGISLSLLVTLVTSDTKDALLLSASVWKAIFIIAFVISLVLTAGSYRKAKMLESDYDIEKICQKIMGEDETCLNNQSDGQ